MGGARWERDDMEEVYTGKKRRRSGLWVGKIDISHQLVYAPQSVEFGVKWSDQRFLLPSSLHPLFFFALPLSPEGGSRGRKIQQGRDQPGNQYSLLHDRPRTSTSSMTKAQNQLARGGGAPMRRKRRVKMKKDVFPIHSTRSDISEASLWEGFGINYGLS